MRLACVCALLAVLVGCVDKPEPWRPDTSGADVDAVSRSDGSAAVDGVTPTDAPPGDDNLAPDAQPDTQPGDCPGGCGNGETCFFGRCVPAGAPCDDGNATDWDGCTAGMTSEIQVNSFNLDDQRLPDVAPLAGGGFVVVWQSCPCGECEGSGSEMDEWGCAIAARIFSESGAPAGDDFVVNTKTQYYQTMPSVAPLGDGFVVMWLDETTGDYVTQVTLQAFDAQGNPLGDEFQGDALDHLPEWDWRPDVAATPEGNVFAAWRGIRAQGGMGILGQYFSWTSGASAWEKSALLDVKSLLTVETGMPRVAAITDRDFVAVWGADVGGEAYVEAFGRIVHDGGEMDADEFILHSEDGNEMSQDHPSVTPLPGGGFLAVWLDNCVHQEGEHGISARRFDADAVPTDASPKPVHQMGPAAYFPDVTMLKDPGGAAVVTFHTEFGENEGLDDIRLRMLDSNLKSGDQVIVNAYTTDYQKFARVAPLNGGNFVVVWESCPWNPWMGEENLAGQDGDGCGIFMRLFDSSGKPL